MHLWWCEESQFSLSNGVYHAFSYGIKLLICSSKRTIASYGSFTPINKVFSLISQEEHQKKINCHINVSSNFVGTMTFVVKIDNSKASKSYKGQKKDRPFYTYCNFHDHTIDKCYKIHGYPLGYKPMQRNNSTYSNNNIVVNQVSNQSFSNSAINNIGLNLP